MAQFRFIGQHSGDRDRISQGGVEFVGDQPSEVVDEVDIDRLRRHSEFEEVDPAPSGPPAPSESERARQANAELHLDPPPPEPGPEPKPAKKAKK